jgi:DNA-binding NarL/FixJ family response regulator
MLPILTERENQVLNLIADGLTNREISCNLSISEATVENHTHHIYRKLGISRRAQAVLYALRANIATVNNAVENRGNPS